MDVITQRNYEESVDEYEGELYLPNYVCVKKEGKSEEETVCVSDESTTCAESNIPTGNILGRMIPDPEGRRPPCLRKWPVYPPKSQSDLEENVHQFRAAQQPTSLAQMCSLRVTSDPNTFRQPAIIATIGPSSFDVPSIVELLEAGVNIFRINMAHTDPCSETEPFRNVIEASIHYKTLKDYEVPIAIMMDLKGPEIRTGQIATMAKTKTKEIFLKRGRTVRLTSDPLFKDRSTDKIIYIDYEKLRDQLEPGTIIYISDGGIRLVVELVEQISVACRVEAGGILRENQKVHLPMLPAEIPLISQYDLQSLRIAVEMDVDVVVVPNTRNADMIREIKKLLDKIKKDNGILIMAKLSSYEGLENIDSILRVADGIVIQRNDLCLEVCPSKMLIAQKEIIGKCNRVGKPVLCTAQMSSLTLTSNAYRRMEMNDIGGAIVDGADGIILIKETALGKNGPECVAQLCDVIREAEAATMQKPFYFDLVDDQEPSVEPSRAIAIAAVQIANKIQAAAILTVTTSGKTAQTLSWLRPRCPVIAITRLRKTARQMNLWRAVIPLYFSAPLLSDWFHDVKARFEYGISYGKERGIISPGGLLVLVSGYRQKAGFTNCIRVVFASLESCGYLDNVTNYYVPCLKFA